ncbi:MAG TPA: hypothetical protein ENH85_06775 [Candidatus Scalindua sp.]|nr:hypothetical protein [Candidatus Scalindua sp.]
MARDREGTDVAVAFRYRIVLLALVNDVYQKELGGDYFPFGPLELLCKSTEEEFLQARDTYFSSTNEDPIRELLRSTEKQKAFNPTLVIDLKDTGIIENSYLEKSIEAKKRVILLSVDIVLNKLKTSPSYSLSREEIDSLGNSLSPILRLS